jgi:hypothetical protein
LLYVCDFLGCTRTNVIPVVLGIVAQLQQLTNLIEREAKLLSALDKAQPLSSVRQELAIACLSSGRLCKQPAPLVVADCFKVYSTELGQTTYRESLHRLISLEHCRART